MAKTKVDKYEAITNQIVESLEKIVAGDLEKPSWIKPWASIGAPRNAFTNRPYQGLNAWMLGMAPYADQRWATYNQIKKAGGQVKKGEKSTSVVLWKFIEKIDKDTGEKKTIPMLRTFNVFNVMAQSEGIELKTIEAPNKDERDANLESILKDNDADIRHGGDRAFYSFNPLTEEDHIQMPTFESFKSADDYYATLSHELVHWSGASKRLNRDMTGRFGNESYAMEELVAELGASFICQDLGINGTTNKDSLAYLASWIKVLKHDTRAIFTASSKARHAVKHLIGKHTETQPEEAETAETTE